MNYHKKNKLKQLASTVGKQVYRLGIYGLIYLSFAISFLFTIGGALFAIPPVCALLGVNIVGQLLIGSICAIGAFWGTYVVQGACFRDMILNLAGIGHEIPKENQIKSEAGLVKKAVVITMLAGNAVFFIAGGYFAMLQILAHAGMQSNLLAAAGSLLLSTINYLPTFALNGMSLYKAEAAGNNDNQNKNPQNLAKFCDAATNTDPGITKVRFSDAPLLAYDPVSMSSISQQNNVANTNKRRAAL